MTDRYHYETFSSESSIFDSRFSDYLNKKYSDNWKVKTCEFHSESDQKSASCLFKRKT
jgi:hypothetical protein